MICGAVVVQFFHTCPAQRTAMLPASHVPDSASEPWRPVIQDVVARLEEELAALGVEVVRAATDEGVREAVLERTRGLRTLTWNADALPYHLFGIIEPAVLGSARREDQAAAEIGLTGCDAAVAESGSLVLLSGPGRSRTVSLLPPVHVAVVRRSDVVPRLADAFERLDARMRAGSSCTVITGPSRTADIELTLTLGIHGPGRLAVVIGP